MPHIFHAFDYTISAFIVHDGNVLLVNHPRYDKWIPVGGHIELDENPEEALLREVREETGLEVTPLGKRPSVESPGTKFLITPDYLDVHEANPPHRHISFTYFVAARDANFMKSDEHDDMRWFAPEELEQAQWNLSPAVRFYCRQAIRKAAS